MIRSCRSCKRSEFEKVLPLGKFYLSEFSERNKKPRKFPLDLILCKKCFLVQLAHTTPPSLLYTDGYGYRSGINATMKKELHEIVTNVLKVAKLQPGNIVVDIGANDGTLLDNFPSIYKRVAFEPITKFKKECSKNCDIFINDFFNYEVYKKILGNKKAKAITAISCFYDIDKPNKFIEDVTKILADDGIFVIQQNYLVAMLQQNAFDNIVHEHLEYYSLLSLENLLNRHNLEVFDVVLSDINGGSFRTFIARKGMKKIKKSVLKMREYEKRSHLNQITPYNAFAKRVKIQGKKLFTFITKKTAEGKKIYVYGASTRGNTLLQYYKLTFPLIKAAVERNPEKFGTKIASVGIPIISEEQARDEKPDYMLVLPWFFKKEFLQREADYLKHGGHFIFPLPKFEIV